jgi:hypothetical protein
MEDVNADHDVCIDVRFTSYLFATTCKFSSKNVCEIERR